MKKSLFCLIVTGVIVLLAGECFAVGSIQFHTEFDRDPGNQKVFTVTVDHFSKWDYGKQYLFLDIMGKPDLKTEADTMYFEYQPYISLGKTLGWHLPFSFIKDSYVAGQYNDGDKDSIVRSFLYGLSVDLDVGIDSLGLSVYFKDYAKGRNFCQITTCWSHVLKVCDYDLKLIGFADYWFNGDSAVFISEPQIRFLMANFFPKGFLSDSSIGSEIEVTHDFFGSRYGWEVNPTVFWMFEF